MDVVILNEHQIAREFTVLAQMDDLLDETLALVVTRMRLAGEDELDGPVLVMRELHDVFKLLKNQRPRACKWQSGARSPMVNASGFRR